MKRHLGLLFLLAFTPLLTGNPQAPAQASGDQLIPVTVYGGSGEKLIEKCSAVNRITADNLIDRGDAQALSFCVGFISGVVDFHQIIVADQPAKGPYCIPAGHVTVFQFARIVLKYGNDHPQQLHFAAAMLVSDALSEAFPCA